MIQAKELMYDETEGCDGSQDNSDEQIELDKERDNG
jgi:hypothetical protein